MCVLKFAALSLLLDRATNASWDSIWELALSALGLWASSHELRHSSQSANPPPQCQTQDAAVLTIVSLEFPKFSRSPFPCSYLMGWGILGMSVDDFIGPSLEVALLFSCRGSGSASRRRQWGGECPALCLGRKTSPLPQRLKRTLFFNRATTIHFCYSYFETQSLEWTLSLGFGS